MPQIGQDFEFDDDGDLVVDDTGDIALATPQRTVIQDIEFRLRTGHWEYEPDPLIGANLCSLMGWPNRRQTGDAAKDLAYRSLIKDARFEVGSLFVDVVPFSLNGIIVFAIVQDYIDQVDVGLDGKQLPTIVGFNIGLGDGQISLITDVKV